MSKTGQHPLISGVFSQVKTSTIGTGTTVRRTEVVSYFYAREREDGVLEVQALGDNVVFGPLIEVPRDDFVVAYMPEPQMSQERAKTEAAKESQIHKNLAKGDKYFRQGKHFSAEYEYGKALALDEDNVRANFGIGLSCLARGDTEKAAEVFKRLVTLDAAFEDEHKHLFNDFGINLRKNGMHVEALAYYARGVELSPSDENLQYNMARAAYEKGDQDLASKHLHNCLELNADHEECVRFMEYLRRRQSGKGEKARKADKP